MIERLEIRNVRGIKTGNLADLCSLVVLVGQNGSGKSTVLEALHVAMNRNPATAAGQVVRRRAFQTSAQAGRWFVWKGGQLGEGLISAVESTGKRRTISLRPGERSIRLELTGDALPGIWLCQTIFSDDGPYQFDMPQEVLELETPDVRLIESFREITGRSLEARYSEAVQQGRKAQISTLLQTLLGDEVELEILDTNNKPELFVSFKNSHAIPVSLAGDGVLSLLRLSVELATLPGGLALVEEPESHLHPGGIRQAAQVIVAAVKSDVQVILSTHSLELIDRLVESLEASSMLDKLAVYRLLLEQGTLEASRFPGPDVAFARQKIEDDLR